jgi:hypothetical protein
LVALCSSHPTIVGALPGITIDQMCAWLFDLDGVLVNSTPAYRAAWARWAQEHGVAEAAVWSDAHGKRPEDIIRRVSPDLNVSDALIAFDRALAAEADGCKAMPGAGRCPDALVSGSWAIVTSGRRAHVRACLAHCDLPTPAVLVCGDDISRGKPARECFSAPRSVCVSSLPAASSSRMRLQASTPHGPRGCQRSGSPPRTMPPSLPAQMRSTLRSVTSSPA